MTDEVATSDLDESQEPEAPATQPEESVTTWKARLAGKDRALSAAKQEAERLKAEREELSRWKAERENADLTELERYQKRIKELEAEREAAVSKALRVELAAKYPLTFDLLGDRTPLDDETWLADKEGRLKGEAEPEEPRIDPNRPRRTPAVAPTEKTAEDLAADLRKMGNPFFEGGLR